MNGMAKKTPITTNRIIPAIQPIIHVKTAFPVEKSKACLTAMIIATNPQTQTAKDMIPHNIGIKLNINKTPGESENPIVLRSSPEDAVPPNTYVPTKYVMNDQTAQTKRAVNNPPNSPIPMPGNP
jgi:hypothetical protein